MLIWGFYGLMPKWSMGAELQNLQDFQDALRVQSLQIQELQQRQEQVYEHISNNLKEEAQLKQKLGILHEKFQKTPPMQNQSLHYDQQEKSPQLPSTREIAKLYRFVLSEANRFPQYLSQSHFAGNVAVINFLGKQKFSSRESVSEVLWGTNMPFNDQMHKKDQQQMELRLLTLQEDREAHARVLKQIEQKLDAALQNQLHLERQQMIFEKVQQGNLMLVKGTLNKPVDGRLIQKYGTQGKTLTAIQNQFQGITLVVEKEAKVFPMTMGKVVFADEVQGYQNLVIVDHGQHILSVYGQLQKPLVDVGEWVDLKIPLGQVSQDPITKEFHVYLELRVNDETVNPLDWFPEGSYQNGHIP